MFITKMLVKSQKLMKLSCFDTTKTTTTLPQQGNSDLYVRKPNFCVDFRSVEVTVNLSQVSNTCLSWYALLWCWRVLQRGGPMQAGGLDKNPGWFPAWGELTPGAFDRRHCCCSDLMTRNVLFENATLNLTFILRN